MKFDFKSTKVCVAFAIFIVFLIENTYQINFRKLEGRDTTDFENFKFMEKRINEISNDNLFERNQFFNSSNSDSTSNT